MGHIVIGPPATTTPAIVGIVSYTQDGISAPNASTKTMTLPSGILSGDILILVIGAYCSGFTTPSGWTLLKKTSTSAIDNMCTFRKVATGSETTVACTISGGGPPENLLMGVVQLRGITGTFGTTTSRTTTAASHYAPTATAAAGAYVFNFHYYSTTNGTSTNTWATGVTDLGLNAGSKATDNYTGYLAAAWKGPVLAGATGNQTITLSPNDSSNTYSAQTVTVT